VTKSHFFKIEISDETDITSSTEQLCKLVLWKKCA